jgi:CYTH domain-containing protein
MGVKNSNRKKNKIERERKFLVRDLPDLSGRKSSRIQQGYIVTTENIEVRIRKKGPEFTLGIKKGSGEKRREEEIEISKGKFDALWPLTGHNRIYKIRYEIPYRGLKIELDIYSGKLRGLKVVEIELKSRRGMPSELPPWIGKEVTGRREFSNAHLAKFGLPKLWSESR